MVAEYQAKWREESASWKELEATVTRENEQMFDVSDAAITSSSAGTVALKLCGHLNYATYHEVYLRFGRLIIAGSDERQFQPEEFQQLGEAYWRAFSTGANSTGER